MILARFWCVCIVFLTLHSISEGVENVAKTSPVYWMYVQRVQTPSKLIGHFHPGLRTHIQSYSRSDFIWIFLKEFQSERKFEIFMKPTTGSPALFFTRQKLVSLDELPQDTLSQREGVVQLMEFLKSVRPSDSDNLKLLPPHERVNEMKNLLTALVEEANFNLTDTGTADIVDWTKAALRKCRKRTLNRDFIDPLEQELKQLDDEIQGVKDNERVLNFLKNVLNKEEYYLKKLDLDEFSEFEEIEDPQRTFCFSFWK